MDSFNQMTQDWAGFFSALAQVSGGLVGLVFVALTFNSRALGVGGNPMLGALAQQTFADFLLLLLISLMMLVPHTPAANIGLMLALLSAVDAFRIIHTLLKLRAHLGKSPGSGWIARRFLLSALGDAQILWVGIDLIRVGYVPSQTGTMLFSGIIVLLISGCRSAWMLVLQEVDK
ncbi:MAG: hypothetical protein ACHQIO_06010 [Nevskiales bacterium]